MTYYDYINEVFDECIIDSDEAWSSYVIPQYKHILFMKGLTPDIVDDEIITYADLKDILELEVERRRVLTNRTAKISEIIWTLLTNAADEKQDEVVKELINKYVQTQTTDQQDIRSVVPKNVSYKKKTNEEKN